MIALAAKTTLSWKPSKSVWGHAVMEINFCFFACRFTASDYVGFLIHASALVIESTKSM